MEISEKFKNARVLTISTKASMNKETIEEILSFLIDQAIEQNARNRQYVVSGKAIKPSFSGWYGECLLIVEQE